MKYRSGSRLLKIGGFTPIRQISPVVLRFASLAALARSSCELCVDIVFSILPRCQLRNEVDSNGFGPTNSPSVEVILNVVYSVEGTDRNRSTLSPFPQKMLENIL